MVANVWTNQTVTAQKYNYTSDFVSLGIAEATKSLIIMIFFTDKNPDFIFKTCFKNPCCLSEIILNNVKFFSQKTTNWILKERRKCSWD